MLNFCKVVLFHLWSVLAVRVCLLPLPSCLLPGLSFATQLYVRTDFVSTECLFCRFLLHYRSFDCSLRSLSLVLALFSFVKVEALEACLELPESCHHLPACVPSVWAFALVFIWSKNFLIFFSISFTWLFRNMLLYFQVFGDFRDLFLLCISTLISFCQSASFVWFQYLMG